MRMLYRLINCLVTCCLVGATSTHAFVSIMPKPHTAIRGTAEDGTFLALRTTRLYSDPSNKGPEKEKGILDFIFNPYESKIPKEIEKDIYAAEANTPAAKERGKRIALYAAIAFTGVLCAFFNGFLTELRNGPTPDGVPFDLDAAGFGWVTSNFFLEFIFTNKIGGGLCLLGGAACGLLAEAEFDTRRINAEKIFEEMQRRRAAKEEGGRKKKLKKVKKKRRSGKEMKRLGALSEVVDEDDEMVITEEPSKVQSTIEEERSEESKSEQKPMEKKEGGFIGTIKGFYEKADNMAASQALLLNKKLEDEGIIEKVTDESGFKVIGREEAAKLRSKKEADKDKK